MHDVSGAVETPAEKLGPLFADVQRRRLFGDSKTFADAVPLLPPAEILAAYSTCFSDDGLREFVLANFAFPSPANVHRAHKSDDLRDHIRSLWLELVRYPNDVSANSSLMKTDQPYAVPGGRFAELYYWDSYFTMLGLLRDGHEDLVRSMIETFTRLIEQFGHIPNGTRTYYLSRSQPPLYYAMLQLLPARDAEQKRRHLSAMIAEHAYWMSGADCLEPGETSRRVVAMPDGARLNRYWDDCENPRDEAYAEDVATASKSSSPSGEVYRALRAGAESGWDFSSRWLGDGEDLSTIRTPDIIAVDLNSFLYGLECTIVDFAEKLGEADTAQAFRSRAQERKAAIHRWQWSDDGYFADFDLASMTLSPAITAATVAPLFAGAANDLNAAQVALTVEQCLLAAGGLRTTLIETREQWDWPNGWAPLQWLAVCGLRGYGHDALADTIASRWTAMVDAEFHRSGAIHEKYDVETGLRGRGGEYVPQIGFGWTNGVTAAFIDAAAVVPTGIREGLGPHARAYEC